MVTVYIIYSRALDRHYVGFAQDLRKRLEQHLAGETRNIPSADDWHRIWSTEVADVGAARALEKKIKGRGAERFLSTGARM